MSTVGIDSVGSETRVVRHLRPVLSSPVGFAIAHRSTSRSIEMKILFVRCPTGFLPILDVDVSALNLPVVPRLDYALAPVGAPSRISVKEFGACEHEES